MFERKTKIVCTIGNKNGDLKTLIAMSKAGMNVARLNFSHGTTEEQLILLNNIRQAAQKTKKSIGIMQDLQGPKIRIGKLTDSGIAFKKSEQIIFSTKIDHYSEKNPREIPVQYKNLHQDLSKNDLILIEDGLNKFQVNKIIGQKIYATALNSGTLKTRKGINVPTASISANPLTAKDLKDLKFGLKHDVDFIALSFVRKAQDIEDLRKILKKHKSNAEIIAKIERHEAIENLEAIIKASDAVMVARGDLGVEIPAEKVPVIQKRIIRIANQYGKPVIVATEVLQSMTENSRATRAEISDAANAIYDHTDALMLSNETAVGSFPVEAVETLNQVSNVIDQEKFIIKSNNLERFRDLHITNEMCHAAAELANQLKAEIIVAVTHSGYTARQISKQRIEQEIITITDSVATCRKLSLTWGVNQVFVRKFPLNFLEIKQLLIEKKLVKKNQKIVIALNTSEKDKQIGVVEI